MYELEDSYWWFVARREVCLQFMSGIVPKDAQILDVGCGTGKGQDSFSQFGLVYGVDYSNEALEFCKERGLTRIARADAEALPFQSDTFDMVVSLDTIEHVPDDYKAVSEIRRVLKPGGYFVMNVPAYMWLWGPHDVALMHKRRYSRTMVRKLFQESGLKVERITYHIFFLFPLVMLSRFMGKFRKGEPEAKLPSIPGAVQTVLKAIQRSEAAIMVRANLPWGSSIIAIGKKAEN